MSWHYLDENSEACIFSPEQGGGSSQISSSDILPSALSKLMPSVERSCLRDNEMEYCPNSQSGTTYVHSTGNSGEVQLTLSAVVSPARTSVARVKVADLPASVRDFGSRCSELLMKLNLVLSSRKTHRTCVPVDSAPSSKDLPAWGMMLDGACWELGTLVRHIAETECGLLPTLRANKWGVPDSHGRTSMWMFPTLRTTGLDGGQHARETLRKLLPTLTYSEACGGPRDLTNRKSRTGPRLRDVLPTLKATDGTRGWNETEASKRHGDLRLGGPLSPMWSEWFMGWPIGWTGLKPLVMDKFQAWRQSLGEFLQRI